MTANPAKVVPAEGGPGDDLEAVLGEPRHREVALDAPALVEHLGVGDGTDVPPDTVVAEGLEEVRGARPRDLDLRERRLVEQGCRLAASSVLGPDRGRPHLPRPTAGPEALVTLRGVELEPVRPLPAGL